MQQAQNYTTGAQTAASDRRSERGQPRAREGRLLHARSGDHQPAHRIFDLVFKPFPWQLQDTSQQLGALGSLIALAALLLLWLRVEDRGRVLALTAPILYPMLFLLVAYSLSAGNAGTGFRYRTHLVVLGAAMLVVLREHALRARAESRELASIPSDPWRSRTVRRFCCMNGPEFAGALVLAWSITGAATQFDIYTCPDQRGDGIARASNTSASRVNQRR